MILKFFFYTGFLASLFGYSVGAVAQSVAQMTPIPSQTFPERYDIVSIKLHPVDDLTSEYHYRLDGYEARGVTFLSVASSAFELYDPNRWHGLPGWALSKRWDISAKFVGQDIQLLKRISVKQRQGLLQALLRDYFDLTYHKSTQVFPIYNLVVIKAGTKMSQSPQTYNAQYPHVIPSSRGTMNVQRMDMDHFAPMLTPWAGRPCFNETGLSEHFDFVLTWNPDNGTISGSENDETSSIFSALEEQLGLKLVPARRGLEVIEVDKVFEPKSE